MSAVEFFILKNLNPLYRFHYMVWVYWWPWWRAIYSGRRILHQWRQFRLVERGQTFLDYGCGTGAFTIPAARMVGKKGKVYAVDCFPRQLEIVKENSRKRGLQNVETILSDKRMGLPEQCVDVVWMCDVLHEVREKRVVLEELHRVLRRDGVLAIYDGMKEAALNYTSGLFSLTGQDGKLLRFAKIM